MQLKRALLLAVTIFFPLTGCQFDAGIGTDFCVDDSDCVEGQRCVSGKCEFSSGSDLANNDQNNQSDAGGEPDINSPGCDTDEDRDGFGVGPNCPPDRVDCDDSDPQTFPGAPTRCNGLDNNCDGTLDTDGCDCIDGTTETCGSDVGACEKGTRTCVNGSWSDCQGEIEPATESCDGLDNNCDGTSDEGCPCSPGDIQECGSDVGTCQKGRQTCEGGVWSGCSGGQGPVAETCNGRDDDCNGATDDLSGLGELCATGRPGVCAPGRTQCVNGNIECESITPSGVEVCNNQDDDCDGEIDNGVRSSCTSMCGPGESVCVAGVFGQCQPINPPEERCNGVDDDCDGQTDESFPEASDRCSTGLPGACDAGTYSCVNGALTCESTAPGVPEVCNGVDDDCDGQTDEDLAGLVLRQTCGQCPNTGGMQLCIDGSWSGCEYRNVELCDAVDNNCDGFTDSDSACHVACNGEVVVGTQLCNGSNATCSLPGEICGDGIDNDCDGTIDQNCNPLLDDMLFVPGGTFIMGSDPMQDNDAASDEMPQRVVLLDPFYIDKFEVSRADYRSCIFAGACRTPTGCSYQAFNINRPAACLRHNDAIDYCAWVGKRLPTEAEWEKAARGPFPRQTLYPYGDAANSMLGNYDCGSVNCITDVDSFAAGASYYGAYNMSGNIGEMVADLYDFSFYSFAPNINPFNGNGSGVVIRGGSWDQDIEFGRVSNRASTGFGSISAQERGFRCAADF